MNSMRATPRPSWMTSMTVFMALSMLGNARVGHAHGFGQAMKAKRDFRDDAQRSLSANEQVRQIVAGARFARAGASADHAPIGQNHREAKHVSRMVP